MMQLYPWQEKIIGLLLESNVSFLVIGGYAVNYYGYVRPTGDIYIWLKPDDATKSAFLAMLEKAGISNESRSHVASLDFTTTAAFHIGQEPFRFDFLTKINGVDFHEAWDSRAMMKMGDFALPVISRNHLILSKISTNRTQDKLDVEELQKLSGNSPR